MALRFQADSGGVQRGAAGCKGERRGAKGSSVARAQGSAKAVQGEGGIYA